VAHTVEKADLSHLVQFHTEVITVEERLHSATVAYQNSRAEADHRHDLIELFDASNHYEDELGRLIEQANVISPPQLRDEASRRWAAKALDLLRARLTRLRATNHLLVEAVDSGKFRPAALENTNSWANAKLSEEDVAIRRSYEALGVDLEEIETIQKKILNGAR
jgi:hypothetical protein